MPDLFRKLALKVVLLAAAAGAIHPAKAADLPDRSEQKSAARVDHQRIVSADTEPEQWLSHGRTYGEQRYSPLDQIDPESVGGLGLAWVHEFSTPRALEATPLMIDGVLYVSAAWSEVHAFDARTGRPLWRYDPHVPRSIARATCCDVVNRGVAAWEGRIFVGTLDGRLVALDARDGSVLWEVMTVDPSLPYTITGAPRIVKGKVLIGNGGAEYGVRGYVSAYDTNTGELEWRFHTVPGDPALGFESETMERAAETWSGEWWKLGGGGTVWDSMAYDAELDLLYIGVGNGSPWNRRMRSPEGGDNLFLSSIVALRPDTGGYVWHYQVVPAETWDYTATQHMILADIEWQGQTRKVLMQAPKSGFFMIIDRITGEFLSAEPFARVSWASHYDAATGRPVENPGQDYSEGRVSVRPTSSGAHNWQPMAFHPGTGLVYIPVTEAVSSFESADTLVIEPGLRNRGVVQAGNPPGDALFLEVLQQRLATGHLLAWDPIRQREVWRYAHRLPWNGGLLATAGNLVFEGGGDGVFRAHRADSGELAWAFDTGVGIIATPISFELDGEQYVSILAGWGGAFGLISGIKHPNGHANGRLLTFKLGARRTLPPTPPPEPIPDPPPLLDVSQEVIDQGAALYAKYCAFCHGTGMISSGTVPDLRRLPPGVHESFDLIVRGGAFESLGMPRFDDVLDTDDARAIQAFVIEKAHEDADERNAPAWWTAIKRVVYEFVTWIFMLLFEPPSHSA